MPIVMVISVIVPVAIVIRRTATVVITRPLIVVGPALVDDVAADVTGTVIGRLPAIGASIVSFFVNAAP
jgi:hypothetical protein